MKFTIIIVFALSCIHTLNRYGIKDTILGNAGLNTKPIYYLHFEKIEKMIKKMGTGLDYNNEKVNNAIIEYVIKFLDNVKHSYIYDIQYSLYKANFLKDYKGDIDKSKSYHKIPISIEYFDKYFRDIKNIDVSNSKVYDKLYTAFYMNSDVIPPAIAHFIKYIKAYLVNKKILKSEKLNTAITTDKEIVNKIVKTLILKNNAIEAKKESRQIEKLRLAKIVKPLDKDAKASGLQLTNSAKQVTNKVDASDELQWKNTHEYFNIGVADELSLANIAKQAGNEAEALSEISLESIAEQLDKDAKALGKLPWANTHEYDSAVGVADELSLANNAKQAGNAAEALNGSQLEHRYGSTVKLPNIRLAHIKQAKKKAEKAEKLRLAHIKQAKNKAEKAEKLRLAHIKRAEKKAEMLKVVNIANHLKKETGRSGRLSLANIVEEAKKQAGIPSVTRLANIAEQLDKDIQVSGLSLANSAKQAGNAAEALNGIIN